MSHSVNENTNNEQLCCYIKYFTNYTSVLNANIALHATVLKLAIPVSSKTCNATRLWCWNCL